MNERQLQKKLKQGWNTWDVRSLATHVLLPDSFALRFALMDPDTRGYTGDFGWGETERFGPHAPDGSYTCIDLKYAGHRVRIETAAEGRKFVAIITPRSEKPFYLHVEASLLWGAEGAIEVRRKTITARTSAGRAHVVTVSAAHSPPPGDPSRRPHIAFPISGPAVVCCNGRMGLPGARRFLAKKREAYLGGQALRAEGDLGEALDAVQVTVAWNTIYDPITGRVITPVSRMWARRDHGGYVLFEWDMFFLGVLASAFSKELAYANVLAMLGEVVPEGHVPNISTAIMTSRDRSEPPVGAYCVLKLWRSHGDRWFIKECFDRLVRWNRFWFEKRDHNNSGLLEWGSDPYPISPSEPGWLSMHVGKLQGAMWESGLDNSPLWDGVKFNEKHHCLELKDVGLNSLVALDCRCLAELASALAEERVAAEMTEKAQRLEENIGALWNNRTKMYLSRHWSGKFSFKLSPCHFYPLTAGIPDPQRALTMAEKHLLNPKEFWGRYVIPSISRDDPAYKDQQYWRGRIWGPMNFLVFEGLRRYEELDDVAEKFAAKSLALLLKEWREKGHVHENYNADTGEGCDVASSDPNYHWGALLGHIALERLIDAEPFGCGLRFGNGRKNAGTVENVSLCGHTYRVVAAGELEVYEDGEPLLRTDRPATVRNFRHEGRKIVFELRVKRMTRLTVLGVEECATSAGEFRGQMRDGIALDVPPGTTDIEAT